MAKVLKIIVNLLLVVVVVCALAIFVPPLLNITTIVAKDDAETNLSVGSVAYALREPVADIMLGDKIIYLDSDTMTYNTYTIDSIDAEDNVAAITDTVTGEKREIPLKSTLQKFLVSIPFIGYISIAMESMEGLLMVGLIVGLLIILSIIFGALAKKANADDDDDEEDDEDELIPAKPVKEKKNRKKDKKQEENAEEEDAEAVTEIAAIQTLDSEEDVKAADTKPVNVLDEAEENAEGETEPSESEAVEEASSDGEELSTKDNAEDADTATEGESEEVDEEKALENAELAANSPQPVTTVNNEGISDVQAALEAALDTQQMQRQQQVTAPVQMEEKEEEEEQLEEIELAIPVKTEEELLQEAYAAGHDPRVIKDDVTGVTLVDFSDCL